MMSKTIYVYENWKSDQPNKIGELYVDFIKGKEVFSFTYEDSWLENTFDARLLDPDLMLYNGRQYAPVGKEMFGVFSDSSPDRWGRLLMDRRESILAKEEDRKPRKLTQSDYLLGVYDQSRMGALRFKADESGDFLSNDKTMAAPPWTSLRTLEEAVRSFEEDETTLDKKWLNQLIGPGSSLGGARPKASVVDVDGSLWIAKFPSKRDTYNIAGWEKVVHDLAKMLWLNVPESRIEKFSKYGDTFLVKRFDRVKDKRIHFASAMTMLGKEDGESSESSYLDLASFIRAHGANPTEDLLELWKRIVFNMLVSNTDDHLRNHGFILDDNGWRLSPLYDVNPVSKGEFLSLNVTENDSRIDLNLALDTAKYYGVSNQKAKIYINDAIKLVSDNWEKIAKQYGISRSSIEDMRPAFMTRL